METTRKEFLKKICQGAVALSAVPAVFKVLEPAQAMAAMTDMKASGDKTLRWGFLIDTYKCIGCGFCVKACKKENEIPYDIPMSRTWVERYVVKKDGDILIDSPNAGRDGYPDAVVEGQKVAAEDIAKAFFVPKLCNHCENPPCVQACPVGATYQVKEGVVLFDRKWCIGCGYCIASCPYGARFFNPVLKVVEKCTFCYHRLKKGLKPACVQACPQKARQIGNVKDPEDPVSKTIASNRVTVLKDEYGTNPQDYYLGLDRVVR